MHGRINGTMSLPDSGLQIGRESQVNLRVAGGRAGRMRLRQGDFLQVELEVLTDARSPRARLYTDLGASGEFCERDMSSPDGRNFTIRLPAERSGTYHFSAQYTLDGQSWFWVRGDLWQLLVFPRALQGLRLYTLIPAASGRMDQWGAVLQRAAELDFNMVHVLPVTKQGASQSPYAATELFTLEPDYLPVGADPQRMDAFEQFVKEAQKHQLGLCLDLVLNHVAIDSELVKRCPHWIHADPNEADGLRRNGFFGHDGFHKWDDLALIHYQHPDPRIRQEIWEHMEGYAFFWARYAAATGGMIRLDNLHSTDPGFAQHVTRRLRREFPELGILGELFTTPDATQKILEFYEVDLLLATTWEHHFSEELRRYFRYIHEAVPGIPWFTPINSHDSGVPAEEFADVHATQPRYILCTLLGIGATGLTQGVESGIDDKIDFIGREVPPIIVEPQDFGPLIKKAHELLVQFRVFQMQGNVLFVDHGHVAIIAAVRRVPDSSEPDALVIANLDIHQEQSITFDLQSIGLGQYSLMDAFRQERVKCDGRILHCTLPRCGFQVILANKN